MPRILALTVRPVSGPDTRYRIEQYVPLFRNVGLEVVSHALFSESYYRLLGVPGRTTDKGLGLGAAFFRRLADIAQNARRYDAVWVCRELFPLGPPLLERFLFHRNPRVIWDIDDAIYLPDAACSGFIHRRLRDFGKLGRIAGQLKAVVCGNAFLAGYFRDKNPNVHVVPTVVPMADYGVITRSPSPRPRIGWIGTPSNAWHLELAREPLSRLAESRDFTFCVVGLSRPVDWNLPNMVHRPWTLDGELGFFADFDIGIMPLRDTPFARGKCAFKIIQYMAAGIPVVASPVGSNLDVVRDGENGFLADSQQEWASSLGRLLDDAERRRIMGEAGRQTVRDRFSLEGHWKRYADIIKECL